MSERHVDLDLDTLSRVAGQVIEGSSLTPAERAELLRIARGYACKDSAATAGVSPETIRARRKRIYRKLGAAGAGEVLSRFLGAALRDLAAEGKLGPVPPRQGGERAPPRAPAPPDEDPRTFH